MKVFEAVKFGKTRFAIGPSCFEFWAFAGSHGEAVGLIARDLDEPVQLELLSQAGVSLSDDQEALRKAATPSSIEASLQITMERFDALCAWFTEEAEELEHICKKGESVERYFIPINESRREYVATTLARAKFGIPKSERRGVLGKLSGLFGH